MTSLRIRLAARCTAALFALSLVAGAARAADPGQIRGERLVATATGHRQTTAEVMNRQLLAPPPGERPEHELEYPDR
ncbi:MAG TPA: hypothetical protein VGE98_11595, partial [Thermoanaerobaculia bacterium]